MTPVDKSLCERPLLPEQLGDRYVAPIVGPVRLVGKGVGGRSYCVDSVASGHHRIYRAGFEFAKYAINIGDERALRWESTYINKLDSITRGVPANSRQVDVDAGKIPDLAKMSLYEFDIQRARDGAKLYNAKTLMRPHGVHDRETLDEWRLFMASVERTLAKIHGQSVVHGDIRESNIMIEVFEGCPLVGHATVYAFEAAHAASATQAEFVGSPEYWTLPEIRRSILKFIEKAHGAPLGIDLDLPQYDGIEADHHAFGLMLTRLALGSHELEDRLRGHSAGMRAHKILGKAGWAAMTDVYPRLATSTGFARLWRALHLVSCIETILKEGWSDARSRFANDAVTTCRNLILGRPYPSPHLFAVPKPARLQIGTTDLRLPPDVADVPYILADLLAPEHRNVLILGAGERELIDAFVSHDDVESMTVVDASDDAFVKPKFGSDKVEFNCVSPCWSEKFWTEGPPRTWDAIIVGSGYHFLRPKHRRKLLELSQKSLRLGGVFVYINSIRAGVFSTDFRTQLEDWEGRSCLTRDTADMTLGKSPEAETAGDLGIREDAQDVAMAASELEKAPRLFGCASMFENLKRPEELIAEIESSASEGQLQDIALIIKLVMSGWIRAGRYDLMVSSVEQFVSLMVSSEPNRTYIPVGMTLLSMLESALEKSPGHGVALQADGLQKALADYVAEFWPKSAWARMLESRELSA